ncbi:S1 family peptidase [Streptomyces sp. NPDC057794]|uniref:S1 family peptidase n=1 Tax=Streptomyces sp. NPDC057794 TaxID=3346251 RepID=UPI00369F2746
MRHARRRVVRRVTRLAAVGGLLLGGVMVTRAVASEPPDPSIGVPYAAKPATGTGTDLVSRLGASRTAGSWVDASGRPVVAVTDERAAAEVERAGARAKRVSHSLKDLKSATATLRSAPRVSGTAWALDYKKNQVVVRGDSTVSASDWSRLTEVARGIGGFVRMERTEGTFTTRINGAEPILSTAGRCSAGFNVTDGRSDFILTAGHCGPDGSVWFADDRGREQVGTSLRGSFPGDDYSLVKYDSGRAGQGADVVSIGDGKGVRITGLADPEVGQKIFRSGSTSGLRQGEVTALNATVNYPEGTVTGLIETDVCAEPGDSGGPMFADGVALGVTSGGSGDCAVGGTTFFQPVTKALSELGVKLIVAERAGGGAGAKPAPSASQGAAAASPGSSAPVPGADVSSLLTRLTDPRNVGPGLLVIAGSLVALVATRWIRAEQDRKAYRQYYSATWG